MNETLEFLVRHGVAVLFAAVFVEQLGVPLPPHPGCWRAALWLLPGKINWFVALTAATFGSVLADSIWFYLGKYGGQRVLNLLCRIRWNRTPASPDGRSLHAIRDARGRGGEIYPGFEHLGAAAGRQLRREGSSVFFLDGLGSLLYSACFILLGVLSVTSWNRSSTRSPVLRQRAGMMVGGRALYRLQVLPANSAFEGAAHGADHYGRTASTVGVWGEPHHSGPSVCRCTRTGPFIDPRRSQNQ